MWVIDSLLNGLSPDDFLSDIKKRVASFVEKRSLLSDDISPEVFLGLLKEYEVIKKLSSRLSAFLSLRFSENTNDKEVLGLLSRFEQDLTLLSNELLFFSHWVIRSPQPVFDRLISSPLLSDFNYYLRRLRSDAPFVKDESVEQVINLISANAGDAFADLYGVFTNGFSFEFNGKKLTREELVNFVHSSDPVLREKAYGVLFSKFSEHSLVLSEIYKRIVLDWRNEFLLVRGYSSPIAVRNHSNDVSDAAVNALLSVVRKNASLFVDYFKLKHSINEKAGASYPFSRVHLYAPYAGVPDKSYSYSEAKDLVLSTYRSFGEDFFLAAKKVFDERHVHSHPSPGKRGGAFCYGPVNDVTPFVLLNFTGSLNDVFTMMHELGHAIHDVFSSEQNMFNYHTVLPMAETASVFGEMLLAQRLLRESDDADVKKAVLFHLLDSQFATIVRQAFFVLFEIFAHDRIPEGASVDELNDHYLSLLKEQFGDMEVPDYFKHEWNLIPHIHETPFYCYAYAWGNLLVLSLYALFRERGSSFVDDYKKLLSAGGSASPKDLLSLFGFDPEDESFWQKGFDIIKDELDELKKLS